LSLANFGGMKCIKGLSPILHYSLLAFFLSLLYDKDNGEIQMPSFVVKDM
jgi:hypothetical protein